MKRVRGAFALLAMALVPLSAATALEAPVAIRPTMGVAVESLLDPSLASRVASPSLNVNLGTDVIMPFSEGSRFSFEPSALFYFYNAEYTANGQAVPTDESFGSAFVLGLLLDAPVVYTLPLGEKISLGFGIGGCFDIRAAFTLDSSYEADKTPLMNRYYWATGRFFTPSTILRGEYKLTDRFSFGFSGRVLWPIYNLWSGDGFGFLDRGIYLIDLTILYKLAKSQS